MENFRGSSNVEVRGNIHIGNKKIVIRAIDNLANSMNYYEIYIMVYASLH